MRYTKTVLFSKKILGELSNNEAEKRALSFLMGEMPENVTITTEPKFEWVEAEKVSEKPPSWTEKEFKAFTSEILCCVINVEIEINGV